LGPGISEGSQTQQRVVTSISKVGLQNKPLVTSGITSKSVQLATSNSSSICGSQTQIQQSQNQASVVQKPTVVQQQVPSSSTTFIQQQSVQQVPHNHGTVAVPTQPQTVIGSAASSSSNTVPLVEVKKEIGLEDVLSAAGTVSQLQTDTKDFLTTKEELMDGAIDDKTGKLHLCHDFLKYIISSLFLIFIYIYVFIIIFVRKKCILFFFTYIQVIHFLFYVLYKIKLYYKVFKY